MKGAAIDDAPVSSVTCHGAVATPVSLLLICSPAVLPVSSGHCHRGAGTLEGGGITVGVVWGTAHGEESHLWDSSSQQPGVVKLQGAGLMHIIIWELISMRHPDGRNDVCIVAELMLRPSGNAAFLGYQERCSLLKW